jgi:SnoaL-like domain
VITLEDIEEIKQLKARYCRCVDLKRWNEFREVFSDDCRYEGTASAAVSPDEFVQTVASSLVELKSVHHVHNPEIRPVSDTRARGSWSLQDYLFWEPGARVPPWLKGSEEQVSVVGFGLYEEEYEKTSGGWKIARMRLSSWV